MGEITDAHDPSAFGHLPTQDVGRKKRKSV